MDSDCPSKLTCGEHEECVDPCQCADNAQCEGASNHKGICTCTSSHPFGDPYLEGCKRKQS